MQSLKEYYMDIGLEQFVEENGEQEKNENNLYFAKKIVDGYEFERELNDNEKKSLIKT